MIEFEMLKSNSTKKNDSCDCQSSYSQFKCGCDFYTGNIQQKENNVGDDRDDDDRYVLKKNIEVRTDRKSNGRRCKNEFNILRHARNETDVVAECSLGIIKSSSGFWNSTS